MSLTSFVQFISKIIDFLFVLSMILAFSIRVTIFHNFNYTCKLDTLSLGDLCHRSKLCWFITLLYFNIILKFRHLFSFYWGFKINLMLVFFNFHLLIGKVWHMEYFFFWNFCLNWCCVYRLAIILDFNNFYLFGLIRFLIVWFLGRSFFIFFNDCLFANQNNLFCWRV